MKFKDQGGLCNYHYKARTQFQPPTEIADQPEIPEPVVDDESECQKGYPIELNQDNLSVASTTAYTAPFESKSEAPESDIFAEFDIQSVKNSGKYKCRLHKTPIQRTEEGYSKCLELFLASEYLWAGTLII